MITTDFSRTFLREGYDMSEVRAFLADVERTIRGQVSEADQIVTAQKAEEIEFSVKLRGFNMDQVDAEIDRLIGVLRGLDREREWAAQHEDELGEGAADVRADEPAPASSTEARSAPEARSAHEARSAPEAPVVPPAASQVPTSDIRPITPGMPRVDSGDVAVSPQPTEAQVAHVWDVDATQAATDSFGVDRIVDHLAADPPIQTVVDQVAPEFGTQEAVDEILRSMTQSIRSNDD